jgi:hypothetical protein
MTMKVNALKSYLDVKYYVEIQWRYKVYMCLNYFYVKIKIVNIYGVQWDVLRCVYIVSIQAR